MSRLFKIFSFTFKHSGVYTCPNCVRKVLLSMFARFTFNLLAANTTMKSKLLRTCLGLGTAILALFASNASAGKVEFDKPFNPIAGNVSNLEKSVRDEICLNGSWSFMPVYKNNKADFVKPETFEADSVKIKIPSPWNVNTFATRNDIQGGDFMTFPSYPKKWNEARIGWMKRDFEVPAAWKGKRVILRFDGVLGKCEVYVNGQKAIENFDSFMPFEADVTDLVKIGQKNELLVGVAKSNLFDENGGKNGRAPYPTGSFWGQHGVGIWQDVWLQAVPEVYVKDVFVKPNFKEKKLTVDVEVENPTKSARTLSADFSIHNWKNLADSSDPAKEAGEFDKAKLMSSKAKQRVTVPANSSKTISYTFDDVNLKEWTPDTPNLYGAAVVLSGASKDIKTARFGWRQFTIEGKDLLLNGKKIVLNGDSWHFMGVPQMTRRYAWGLFKMMKDANVNAVRFHAQPYPEFYMDVADEMGICVLDESAIWASSGALKYDSPEFWKNAEDHLRRLVKRDRNHPSVFGWSVCNEVFAVGLHVYHSSEEIIQDIITNINKWVKLCRELDPTRDWISGDGETNRPTDLPTKMGHYADIRSLANSSSVPWGIGEQTMAYYGTPLQASKFNGERAFESAQGRMEAIALDAYQALKQQHENGASYASVFNVAWYALKPLPLGLKDTSKKPTLDDGIHFGEFKENTPGMQPERLGPYTTTINPQYDPNLPLYDPWPMFDAVKAANSTPIAEFKIDYTPVSSDAEKLKAAKTFVLAPEGSQLPHLLELAGLEISKPSTNFKNALVIIDGSAAIENFDAVKRAASAGANIFVWGISPESAEQLNGLLKDKIELSERRATSFLKKLDCPLLKDLNHSDLYFSELVNNNTTLMKYGIGGDFAKKGKALVAACPADWTKWNKRPEEIKTGALLRSEREENGSPNTVVEGKLGKATLTIASFDFSPLREETFPLITKMLSNLGANFSESKASQYKALDANCNLEKLAYVKANSSSEILKAKDGKIKLPASSKSLKFWLYSPRSLVDLLAEPNMPVLDLVSSEKVEVLLNGKNVSEKRSESGKEFVIPALQLDKGWNEIEIQLPKNAREFSGRLECKNNSNFLSELRSSIEPRK